MMKNKLTTFYIVRHGETDWNKQRLIQGQTDIILNETGKKQAKEIARQFKSLHLDLAFSSDLLRAKETTEIIALEHRLVVETVKVLRERNFGSLEGQPSDILLAHLKLMLALNNKARETHRVTPDAENEEEFSTRLFTFFRETAVAFPDKKILVGTHGGVLRMILIHLGIKTHEEFQDTRFINGGYIKLTSDGTEFFVEEVVGLEPRKKGSTEL